MESAKCRKTNFDPILEGPNGEKYAYNPFARSQKDAFEDQDRNSSQYHQVYCGQCRQNFRNISEFEQHNNDCHDHKKLFSCSECNSTFRRQDHLKRHIQSLHYNHKYCICPVCHKDFKRQDIVLKHIKKTHTTDSEIFYCRECQFQCNSLSELEKHENSHMMTERHVCEHCKALFKRRDHMLRHVKSQHLNQSVVCPICNQSYKRRDHVVRHVREKHKMGYLNGKLVTAQDMISEQDEECNGIQVR